MIKTVFFLIFHLNFNYYKIKDNNIRESKAMKRYNKQILTLVECQNQKSRIYMYKSKQNCM